VLQVVAFVHIHLHLFHHVKGSPVDYVGVALAAFASWAGLPGPGESVLIAAAIFASKHKLDITPLLFWAFIGANVGGILGWLVGLKAGRTILTAPGPFHRARRRAAVKGREMFRRLEVVAVLLTPSWVAGINHSRARVYLPTNALSAVAWAAGIGLAAYYVGPPILDLIADVGLATGIALGVLVLVVGVVELIILRRRHRARRREHARKRPDAGGEGATATEVKRPDAAAESAPAPEPKRAAR
jgi:membrane protein DedA with SNARE-associated domain